MPGDPPPAGVIWPWSGTIRSPGSYGVLGFNGQSLYAHRISYEIFRGPIPADAVVRHRNDIPHDVNPWNLEDGTQLDNIADTVERGRQQHGLRHWNAKLSVTDVREIRQMYAAGGWTHRQLSELYSVSAGTISKITLGDRWQFV
jgi:hypothetical protein